MFRASIRSASDPLRDHVCLSCLSHRFGAPSRLRQFHARPALRVEAGNGTSENNSKDAPLPPKPNQGIGLPKENQSDAPSNQSSDNALASKSTPPNPEKKTLSNRSRRAHQAKNQLLKKLEHLKAKSELHKKQQEVKTTDEPAKAETTNNAAKTETSVKTETPVKTVTKLLERTKKTQKDKNPEEQPRRKLTHVSSFVREKTTGSIEYDDRNVKALDYDTAPVPRLSFGLDRVLFNPGVYQLRDPRSRVYNFDPYLGQIMPVTEFDFNTLKDYITSSKDETLRSIAVKEKKKYVGSSSSMTSVLSHFHYLLSAWRPVDTRTVSRGFPETLSTFTRLLRAPAAMFLHYQDGVYAIDADKEFDHANILMNLGKSMEKLLTLPKEDFERYRRTHENKISAEEEEAIPESYHFSSYGNFIMRSQLDAYDHRLPGTGMFDLKTRAVVSIRQDAKNFEHGLGYEIKDRYGAFESYEREFFDMIRAAFLKYSLQVRIGRMDGIFVAFHNVERIFGFQYIGLPEMDQALHGQNDTALGDAEFQLSLGMWQKILDKATEKFPEKSLRFHFETRDAVTPFMYIFAEPVTQDEIKAIQSKNKAAIDAYQQRLLNLQPSEDDSDLDAPPAPEPVEEVPAEKEQSDGEDNLLAIALTVRNKVNDIYVERPMNFTASDKWSAEYEMSELSPVQGRTLYRMCQARRQKELAGRGEDEQDTTNNHYLRRLRQIAKQGRRYREQENVLDKEHGIVVLGEE
ncbi:mitochondrial translation protein [Penicillium cinerascens]|uniref:Mitochondrial translation protein n=1 Tax=Penicillium cinerascens TaxID=70096 RepID=A0A9W9MMM5_9EURO|nr:mitochondrial translation protein [Penicillium cinerascens]KAJ5203995.1 mitochondrial translation protein [Penicillium cinerascens]